MRKCLQIAGIAALTGCQTLAPQPTKVVVQEVPTPVPCVTEVPKRPVLLAERVWDKDGNAYEKVIALRVDRGRLLAHVAELEAVLRACVGDPK